MSLEEVADRYAHALLEIGVEQNNLARLADEVRDIAAAYVSSAELRGALENPLVDERARKALLGELADRMGLGPVIKNTLGLLADRQRLAVLPPLARALARLADERAGVVRAHVTSAVPLSEDYAARLKGELERTTGRRVVLDRAVDPTLLGGVVTRVGDRIIDGSLRTKLASLRRSLLMTEG